MTLPDIRKGMPPRELDRAAFEQRYRAAFVDPAFARLRTELDAIVEAAWDAYSNARKSPRTSPAGDGFADPTYEISVDWLAARDAIRAAEQRHADVDAPARILIVNGSSRTEHTCPGEMSKSWRLVEMAAETLADDQGIDVESLDLSRVTSEFGRNIHPCKSCVSTSIALCHWPSHQALDQDTAFQQEVRNAATALARAVLAQREGKLVAAGHGLPEPRPK